MGKRRSAILVLVAGAGLLSYWYFRVRLPAVPQRPLRIGFENNPPVQIRTPSGFSGLSVEAVSEAARRAGIELQWVETGESSEESLRKGLVDLWPLMIELPYRRKYIYFAKPWVHNTYVLIFRGDAFELGRDFKGRIVHFALPVHTHLLHDRYPEAQMVPLSSNGEVTRRVCTGAADVGFLDSRAAVAQMREKPAECGSAPLRFQKVAGMDYGVSVASTFDAALACDRIQREIDHMFRDGTLSAMIAQYSYFGLDDTWASYEMMATANRTRWLAWGIGTIAVALGLALWLAAALRLRKSSEAALRESEERFRNMANTAPGMIVASGPDGQATFFNNVWLDFTGRTMEREIGYKWLENVHPDDRDSTLASYSSSLTARKNCNVEYRLRRADGEYRQILCNGVPRFERDGTFDGYIASCIDLTDIRRTEEEARARHNFESLGVLASGIAHDFNNLLGGALSYSELAQAKVDNGARPDEELQRIRSLAVRGAEIVRQLMIFAGKETGAFEPVQVPAVVKDMLELLKVSISKHAVLNTSLAEDLPPVFGNAAQLRQVVMNLVINASEAIGEHDGVIRISTTGIRIGEGSDASSNHLTGGEYLELVVSDTGVGMTPDTQKRLFEPFFTTKFAGRGMGLAVVQRIVQRHGGTIQVVSAPDKGARIRILLPCATEAVYATQPDTAPETGVPTRGIGSAILIVEDEVALRTAIARMLQGKGFSVIQAGDGTAALDRLRSHNGEIGAMLLDLTLPGASSRDVFEEAKRRCPNLHIILTSAYSQEIAEASFPEIGAARFIRKPFPIADLLSLIREPLPR